MDKREEIIKEQLSKTHCEVVKKDDTTFLIKQSKLLSLQINHCYRIVLNNDILNNTVLYSNWNNETIPPSLELQIDVLNLLGNMVNVMAIDEKMNKRWKGWIPLSCIIKIEEI